MKNKKENFFYVFDFRNVKVMCMLSRFSRVQLSMTPWIGARQAPLSKGFSRQEYWSGLPCPPPGDLPDPGIEPQSFTSLALVGRSFTIAPPGKPPPLTVLPKY